MRFILVFIFTLILSTGVYSRSKESLLEELDGVIAVRHVFDEQKSAKIEEAKTVYEAASTDADRYNALRNLYEGYRTYKIDSAIIIADKRLEIARSMRDNSKIASATLNLAEGYVKSGAADKAISILDTLSVDNLEDYHKKYRISIYRNAYELKAATALLARDRMDAHDRLRAFRDDAASGSAKNARGYYTLEAERLSDAGLYKAAVAKMEEADRIFDFSEDAAMQYKMGEIYLAAGQVDKAMECLARSSVIDLTSGTKEYRSLILLASILFEKGDVDRAFEYINCAFEDADFSKSSLRTTEVMKSMPIIDKAFHEIQNKVAERTKKFLIIAAFLVVMLLLSLVLIIRAYRINRRMLSKIEEINGNLEEKNDELVKADSLKLSHINALMMAYAAYIARLKDFRKTIFRLMKTNQYDKVLDTVKSDKVEARDIATFHEMFDESFLSMFPGFVNDVNRCFEKPVELKTEGRLTPELRVIAMVKLGMMSTEEIARMLQYSPQTVYNLRSSIKSMLKVSKEEFEAYLKTI